MSKWIFLLATVFSVSGYTFERETGGALIPLNPAYRCQPAPENQDAPNNVSIVADKLSQLYAVDVDLGNGTSERFVLHLASEDASGRHYTAQNISVVLSGDSSQPSQVMLLNSGTLYLCKALK